MSVIIRKRVFDKKQEHLRQGYTLYRNTRNPEMRENGHHVREKCLRRCCGGRLTPFPIFDPSRLIDTRPNGHTPASDLMFSVPSQT